MPQSIVSARAARRLHANCPERQTQIVHDNQQILQLDFFLLQPVAHGIAAEVHKCGGLQQHQFGILHPCVRHEPVTPVVKSSIGRLSEGVQYSESDVVAGAVVLVADVTQPRYQIFHSVLHSSFLAAALIALRVIFTWQTTTLGLVTNSRPSKLSSPTLIVFPRPRFVTSMSKRSGICV